MPSTSAGAGASSNIAAELTLGGVAIADGDVVVGDEDGALVIPDAALVECLKRAVAKAGVEDEIGKLLESGAASRAMFDKFGVM